ncbi:tetratricopeptide repeat protein [Arenimonas oryziterrae]|uniref:Tetratrico peptide repeat group 5 domain-containing protein n=1 Tax=Arenimonas oryziterrae DSM 21050 = YC6267 TaxID=1121015 RepID=A0A091BFC5_9GAMM|nr:tetratricopeptide repeat protein [Arenimonas oryziterrae]KFN43080.1 hypothetical protein N789_10990 [Arenimonas oryziterrae DSM 21050 = YC6267]
MKPSVLVLFSLILAATLSACSSGGTATTRKLTPVEMLAQVRAAGQIGIELDVQPLRDPQVEDLRQTATQAEGRGDFDGASRSLSQALTLVPNDPDLLQWQAELALVTRNWAQAEQIATLSYNKGPKLGGLCRRSWTTIRFAREARGDAAGAAQAQQRVPGCAVTPPVRM